MIMVPGFPRNFNYTFIFNYLKNFCFVIRRNMQHEQDLFNKQK